MDSSPSPDRSFLQGAPYIIEVEEGRTGAFCACGRSGNLPYCDGSHTGTDHRPHVITFEKSGRIAICGCGRSERLPHCDGSHKNPPPPSTAG